MLLVSFLPTFHSLLLLFPSLPPLRTPLLQTGLRIQTPSPDPCSRTTLFGFKIPSKDRSSTNRRESQPSPLPPTFPLSFSFLSTMRSKKHSSHASTTRANPLPRGSACLGCESHRARSAARHRTYVVLRHDVPGRSRRVKCDGEWPCKACIRHSRFHSLPDEDCQCVYAAPSTKSAGKRTAPPADETTSDGAEGVVVVEEVQPRPFGQPDSERLMELESHMVHKGSPWERRYWVR